MSNTVHGRGKVRFYLHIGVAIAALTVVTAAQTQKFDAPEPGARSPRNANYQIDVRLDHGGRTLRGNETIRWRNISARPTTELQLHLYWNAWCNL